MPKWLQQWAFFALPAVALALLYGALRRAARSRRALLAENRALERELSRAEAAGEEWKRQLEQADRLAFLGMTTAHVAHEINNPLLFLSLNLPRIRELVPSAGETMDPAVREELLDAVADSESGVERIRRIADDLKAFSRRHDPGPETFALGEVVRSALAMVAPLFPGRACIEECNEGTPEIRGSRVRILQVVTNLLRNAIEAFPSGRTKNTVRVVTRTSESGDAVLVVEDDGPGIPTAHLERIFEPFFTTKPSHVGTGLGLSICREIVQSHAGRITVEQPPSGGTRFVVAFPAASSARPGALLSAPANPP